MNRGWVRSSLSVALSIMMIAVSVGGCAGTMPRGGSFFDDKGKSAMICGAGGAAVGAAAGAALGGSGRGGSLTGALVGAAIGAVVGGVVAATACFAIAEYRSQQVKSYDETRQAVDYQASQGEVVQITKYELAPAAASPGTEVTFNATYYVMTPNPDQDVPMTETRIVKMQDTASGQYKELGRSVHEVTVKPGTRQADGKWMIRSGVSQARYLVIFEVAKAERKDAKELPLIVTKDQAVLTAPSNRMAQVVVEGTKAADGPTGPTTTGTPAVGSASGTSLASLGEQQPKTPVGSAVSTAAVPVPGAPRTALYFVASKVVGQGSVREGPSARYRIIGEIRSAEQFLVVERVVHKGEKNPWYKIRLDDGREGWVAGSLGEEIRQ